MLALHDGDFKAAWTNLMAATRLVTAWQTEPIEVSRLVRFADAREVLGAIWQALQTNNWTDGQLDQLQQAWAGADFFRERPEVTAFKRASYAREFEQAQSHFAEYFPAFGDLLT